MIMILVLCSTELCEYKDDESFHPRPRTHFASFCDIQETAASREELREVYSLITRVIFVRSTEYPNFEFNFPYDVMPHLLCIGYSYTKLLLPRRIPSAFIRDDSFASHPHPRYLTPTGSTSPANNDTSLHELQESWKALSTAPRINYCG